MTRPSPSSIYLAPDMTGQGLGRRLYAALFDALKGEDIHRIFGGITQPNEASVRLHRAFGFEPVGVYREVGRKFGRFWDVATLYAPVRQLVSLRRHDNLEGLDQKLVEALKFRVREFGKADLEFALRLCPQGAEQPVP